MDAISVKKINDRSVATALVIFAHGIDYEKFIDVLYPLDILDYSILLLDDIQDRAERRGNKLAHHIKYGIGVTLAVSMYLKSLSSIRIIESSLPDETKIAVLEEMENMNAEIYEGQFLDLDYEKKGINQISIENYIKMVSLTTGASFARCFRIGGILSGCKPSALYLLGQLGLLLGIMGQIRDDLMDYLPDEREIWKTPLLDFKRNKKRLPLIIGWNNATSKERSMISNLQKKKKLSRKDYALILKILMKPQNLEKIRELMQRYREKSFRLINKYNFTSEGKELLKTFFLYTADELT